MTTEANLKQLERLFAFWPHPRVEADTTRAYVEVMANANPDDVLTAVGAFVFGKLDRNHAFLPSPGELSAQITKARNARLDEEQRNRPRLAPALKVEMPPERRKSVIERLKAQNDGYLIKPMMADEGAERVKLRKAQEAIILAAFEGDEEAIAAWRAENMARGIAARAAVEGLSDPRLQQKDAA